MPARCSGVMLNDPGALSCTSSPIVPPVGPPTRIIANWGGLVDLHAEAKFARIKFDGAFHVGHAQGEPFQSNLRHGLISLSARSVRDELRPRTAPNWEASD